MGLIFFGIPEQAVLEMKRRFGIRNFVETGTFQGETTHFAAQVFERVYTVEIDPRRHTEATERFRNQPHVTCLLGDSAEALHKIVPQLQGPTLFWLDAHWSRDGRPRTSECPLEQELQSINDRGTALEAYILVDDARYFVNPPPAPLDPGKWPTMTALLPLLAGADGRSVAVIDDIIFALPKSAQPYLAALSRGERSGDARLDPKSDLPPVANNPDVAGGPPPVVPPAESPKVNTLEWLELLSHGEHKSLCEKMLFAIKWVGGHTRTSLDAYSRRQIDDLTNLILFVLSSPTFIVPDEFTMDFVAVNHLISSIVALSSFKNTDRYLEMIRLQQNNFVKILALYSARNTVKFDIETIFRTSPQMASVWYAQYAQLGKAALPSDLVSRNLKEHVERLPAAFLPTTNLPDIYMGSTYVDGIADRPAKRIINESVQRSWGDVKIENTPNRTKIAVLARHWHKHHPAYRICRGYISSLRPKYHVTLFNLGGTPDVADFDDVRILTAHLGLPDIRPLKGNDFQALIYPDANGSDEAISLTNLRIAPIQIALLGHPVSTFGSKIDYFISGADVEGPAAGRHYSERVVFLPGMGCTHQPPLYELPTSRPEPAAGAMVINLPANARKLNAAYLNVLGRIMKRASRPLLMRFFTGGAISENNDYIPFRDSLADHLPAAQFEIIDWLDYADYMAKLREGHFSLDPFHMGGCNSVADSLYVRRPALCCEGDRWFNRIGPRMLRVAGLPELIARSPAEYEEIALRLIAEDDWRKMLAQRLASADLMSTLFSPKDGEYFRKALDYLIDHHQSLSNDGASDPIRINIDA